MKLNVSACKTEQMRNSNVETPGMDKMIESSNMKFTSPDPLISHL